MGFNTAPDFSIRGCRDCEIRRPLFFGVSAKAGLLSQIGDNAQNPLAGVNERYRDLSSIIRRAVVGEPNLRLHWKREDGSLPRGY